MYNGFNWSDFSKRVFNTLLTMFFGFLMHLEEKQQFNNKSLLKKKNYNRLDFQLLICLIITWPVRPRAQFPWKTIREKVLYEGRTRQSDRAGKALTALLEMRTALLETATAKSMQVNDKNNFLAAKVCSLQNESRKWTFRERILLSRRIVPCRTTSPTHSKSKERNLTLLTNEEACTFLRSQQANRQSRKQLFRINCPITNLCYKHTISRRNFFPWKTSKNSSWVKSKKTKEVNKVRYKCSLRVSEFLREVI